jgi:carbamate kinase
VEAVIDKDLASALLARDLGADMLVMLTDVPHLFLNFGEPEQKAVRRAHPDALDALDFAAGSMGPKVEAACQFARATGRRSAIGQLSDLERIVDGEAGSLIALEMDGIEYGS